MVVCPGHGRGRRRRASRRQPVGVVVEGGRPRGRRKVVVVVMRGGGGRGRGGRRHHHGGWPVGAGGRAWGRGHPGAGGVAGDPEIKNFESLTYDKDFFPFDVLANWIIRKLD